MILLIDVDEDHIIRDEEGYQNHWKYIDVNPAKWAEDAYYEKCSRNG